MTRQTSTQRGERENLVELFLRSAGNWGSKPALVADGGKGERYTYDQVAQLTMAVAGGLAAGELAPCERVGLLSENRPEWVIAYLAILAAGKTVVPIDANLKLPEIHHIISDAGLNTLFVAGNFVEALAGAYPSCRLFCFESGSPRHWRRIARPGLERPLPPAPAAVWIYTSGTTGAPKVVMLSHRNLLANLEGVEQALQFGPGDLFLSVLPLHHTFEATCGFLTPISAGATIVYARSLKSKEILEDLKANHATIMCGVPLLFEKMHNTMKRRIGEAPIVRRVMFALLYFLSGVGWRLGRKWGRALFSGVRHRAGLSSIRMLVSGGAPLSPEIARFFNLIGVDFMQGYGLTECSPVVAVNRPDDICFGSVGLALPNLEVRILDPDPLGEGEILIRGDSVMSGYRNNPELNAAVIRDGWFYTGDLGRMKEDHLWITGRKKNVIVSAAGKNIHPEELEEKLLASPFVLEAVVFGRQREEKQGEEVRAVIVPDMEQLRAEAGSAFSSEDDASVREVIARVVAETNSQVADFKRIVGFVVQREELEKTSSRKIKRFVYAHQRDKASGKA